MKELFKSYYEIDEGDYEEFWKDATFVFDTNVLLNLYRYQSSTTKSLLEFMKKISDRVWIPYHVGLEFQRNRLPVIAGQHTRFDEVRGVIESAISSIKNDFDQKQLKTKHSHIDPDEILEKFNKVQEDYFKELDGLEERSATLHDFDNIRSEIDDLFEKNIGAPPKSQKDIDEIQKEGEERYKHLIPPGFADITKEKDSFCYSGIIYLKKFGDLIVWKQIIQHAKDNNLTNIIFVTDDNKQDWWLKVKGKTAGPRPELIDEIQRKASVEKFHIYNVETLLKHANRYIEAKIDQDAIKETRELFLSQNSSQKQPHAFTKLAEDAVLNWLKNQFNADQISRYNVFPDFIVTDGSGRYGFEVKVIYNNTDVLSLVSNALNSSRRLIKRGTVEDMTIVLVSAFAGDIEFTMSMLRDMLSEEQGNGILIAAGVLVDSMSDDNSLNFLSQDEMYVTGKD